MGLFLGQSFSFRCLGVEIFQLVTTLCVEQLHQVCKRTFAKTLLTGPITEAGEGVEKTYQYNRFFFGFFSPMYKYFVSFLNGLGQCLYFVKISLDHSTPLNPERLRETFNGRSTNRRVRSTQEIVLAIDSPLNTKNKISNTKKVTSQLR